MNLIAQQKTNTGTFIFTYFNNLINNVLLTRLDPIPPIVQPPTDWQKKS